MILLTHPAQIDQVDSKNKDLGSSYMIKEKVIKILQLIVGVAKFCRVSMRFDKFRFPIGVFAGPVNHAILRSAIGAVELRPHLALK